LEVLTLLNSTRRLPANRSWFCGAPGLPDAEHVNPNGGAIALGHPLGMSGAKLALTALHPLEKSGGKRALATLYVGVGQGASLAIERL
jgi:3-oxoadipyl-CoA thiolase